MLIMKTMADIDNEILKEFQGESKILIEKMNSILEESEGDPTQVQSLEEYGNNVDRIMGAAKSLALLVPADHLIHKIADYAAICKAVGYKSSQIRDNEDFYNICVALLMDGTEVLEEMIDNLTTGESGIKDLFTTTFLERLRWVSSVFGSEVRASVDVNKGQKKLSQNEIDDLLKKLGLD
jgi:chemotaxis protein histidine kinase CheA